MLPCNRFNEGEKVIFLGKGYFTGQMTYSVQVLGMFLNWQRISLSLTNG